jgi:hypothetical protein
MSQDQTWPGPVAITTGFSRGGRLFPFLVGIVGRSIWSSIWEAMRPTCGGTRASPPRPTQPHRNGRRRPDRPSRSGCTLRSGHDGHGLLQDSDGVPLVRRETICPCVRCAIEALLDVRQGEGRDLPFRCCPPENSRCRSCRGRGAERVLSCPFLVFRRSAPDETLKPKEDCLLYSASRPPSTTTSVPVM